MGILLLLYVQELEKLIFVGLKRPLGVQESHQMVKQLYKKLLLNIADLYNDGQSTGCHKLT